MPLGRLLSPLNYCYFFICWMSCSIIRNSVMNLQKSASPVSSSTDLCPCKAWSLPVIVPFVDTQTPLLFFPLPSYCLTCWTWNIPETEVNVIKMGRKDKPSARKANFLVKINKFPNEWLCFVIIKSSYKSQLSFSSLDRNKQRLREFYCFFALFCFFTGMTTSASR